jgi:hypothetical protein
VPDRRIGRRVLLLLLRSGGAVLLVLLLLAAGGSGRGHGRLVRLAEHRHRREGVEHVQIPDLNLRLKRADRDKVCARAARRAARRAGRAESEPLEREGERREQDVVVRVQVVAVLLVDVHLDVAHVLLGSRTEHELVRRLDDEVVGVVVVVVIVAQRDERVLCVVLVEHQLLAREHGQSARVVRVVRVIVVEIELPNRLLRLGIGGGAGRGGVRRRVGVDLHLLLLIVVAVPLDRLRASRAGAHPADGRDHGCLTATCSFRASRWRNGVRLRGEGGLSLP